MSHYAAPTIAEEDGLFDSDDLYSPTASNPKALGSVPEAHLLNGQENNSANKATYPNLDALNSSQPKAPLGSASTNLGPSSNTRSRNPSQSGAMNAQQAAPTTPVPIPWQKLPSAPRPPWSEDLGLEICKKIIAAEDPPGIMEIVKNTAPLGVNNLRKARMGLHPDKYHNPDARVIATEAFASTSDPNRMHLLL